METKKTLKEILCQKFMILQLLGRTSWSVCCFYGNMRQVKVKLIDSLPQLGGQPAILYPEKSILDVPGFTNLTGEELSNRLIEQVKRFDTPIFLNETVEDIRKEGDLFTITTSRQVHQSKAVIIAMGGGAFKPRALDIEELKTLITSTIMFRTSNNMKDSR